jgi:phosphate transport system protein
MNAENQGQEIRRGFHTDLDELREDVQRLGHLATASVAAGTNAFLSADVTAAEAVIEADKELDDLMISIEMRSCELLARQQPMAIDLRTILTILRTIHELERCGDYMVNIAKATRRMYPLQLPQNLRHLVERMRDQATVQLETAVDAFVDRDVAKAHALEDMDDVMDDLQKDLLKLVFESGESNDSVQLGVQVALVGRYFERVADHAVNVGERVQFMVNGFSPIE